MKRISLVAVLALGGLLAGGSMATAQDAKPGDNKPAPGGRRAFGVDQQLERMTTELKLTDEQKPKVKAVLEESQKKRQELRDVPQDQRREKMQAIMQEQNKKLKEILTSEQMEKWQKSRPAGRPGGPRGTPGAPSGEKKAPEKKAE